MAQKVIIDTTYNTIVVKPLISNDEIKELLMTCFGLEVDQNAELQELNSYRDRNYFVEGKLNTRGNALDAKYQHCRKFILKIYNTANTEKLDWYENIDKMITSCNEECSAYFKLPLPVLATNSSTTMVIYNIPLQKDAEVIGSSLSLSEISSSHEMLTEEKGIYYGRHRVRLSVFIPGAVQDMKTMNDEQAYNYGKTVAILHLAFQKIDAPQINVQENWSWNLINVMDIYDTYVKPIANKDRKKMAESILEDFSNKTLPTLKKLPRQWIHGDLNEQNLIYSQDTQSSNDVVGVIDFDDVLYSYRVIDLAYSLMHITNIITSTAMADRAMELAKQLFCGYTSIIEISDTELECVFNVMLVRYVVVCCTSTYDYEYVEPGNEYLRNFVKAGWKSMKHLALQGKDEFLRQIQAL